MTRKLTLVNSLKLLLLTLIVMNLSNAAYARKVTLTKAGGNGLLYTTGITLVPNYSQTTITNTIDWDELNSALGTVTNWTPIFNSIATMVNEDAENYLQNVSYKIEIDAPSATNPMIVCKQQAGLDGYFKASKNSMLFSGDTTNFINQIIVTSGHANNKAYLKFADSIYYGSWLDTGQTIHFYVATGIGTMNGQTYYTTSSDTGLWKIANWALTTATYTNNSGHIMPLDSVTPMHPWRHVSGVAIQGYAGCFIEAEYCNHILVEKLDIDGNSEHAILGGVYGDGGIQIAYSGVYYFNCTHSMIRHCRSHSMGEDGFQVAGGLTNDISIDTCVMEYNGRQGFSWDGGNAIKSTGSHFSHSGKAFNIYRNYLHASTPSAGIDIESENSGVMTNGSFVRCVFENNTGFAIANDAGDSAAITATHDMHFSDCTFYEPDRYGIYIKGEKFRFDSCHIYCTVTGSGLVLEDSNKTIYNKCDFEDKPYIDTNAMSHYWPDSLNLLQMDGYKRTQFKDCTFTVNDSLREFALLKTGPVASTSEYITIQNCTFNYKNIGSPNNAVSPPITEFDGVMFKGKNLFKNHLHNANSFHNIQNETIIQDGSGDACDPSTLTVEGRISHCIKDSMHVNGYSTYIIGDEAQTCVGTNAGVVIDQQSKYIVKAGGSLNSGSSVEVNGEMIQEANSYLQMDGGNFKNTQAGALLYIDPACNLNGITFNPIWGNSMIGQWYGTTLPLCVQGNHPSLSAYACSTPFVLYNNISTNGAFSVMYNHTNVKCNGGNTGSITCSVAGNSTYSFKLNTVTVSNPMTNLSAGTYTVIVSDTTCASSTNSFTVTITEPSILQISSVSSTPILCNGGTSDITVNASGGTPSYTYNLNGAAYQVSNIFNSNVAGTYTVSAKDANDCVSTSTIVISQPSILSWSTAKYKNINCNVGNGEITVTAQGGTPTYEYKLNGGGFSTTNIFSISAVGTYTVTAKDANGCLITTTFIINAPTLNHCCSATANAIVATQNVILLYNPTAAQVLANYATSSNTLSNKTLYVDGTFTIDHDITFDSCTLYFTDLSYVQMQSPYTLNIDSSTLEASCDYWYGILADSVQQKVAVKNNSIIKDAIVGVYISKDALAEISDSRFINNQNSGIVFSNMTSTNYAGFVLHNTFTSNSAMIAPYTKGSFGITANNVTLLNIGDSTDAASGNDFTNLFTGIFVNNNYSSAVTPSSHIGIFNNTFDNIKNTNITGNYVEALKMNNCYTGINVWTPTNSTPPQMICSDAGPAVGAAIFAKNTLFNMSDALINVKNTEPANNMLVMQNCDKGIVSISTSVHANNLYINNCMMGIMNAMTTGKDYTIEHNTLNDIFLGIQVIDNPNTGTTINYNKINCSLFPNGIATASTMGAPMLWPKGIELSHFINTITNSLDVIEDTISIPHYAGLGISLNNAGSGVAVKNNIINLANNNATQLLCSGSTILAGISSNIALGARIHRNTINGNTAGVYNTLSDTSFGRVDAAGILINHGQNQAIGCNVISNTRFGLLAWDANNTSTGDTLNIQGNEVLGADAGWVCRHLANEGTLGNIGGLANDNNNKFTGLPPIIKVFKFCDGADFYKIYTSSINQLSESLSENMNTLANDCRYQIQNNPSATLFDIVNDCGGLQIVANDGEIRIDEALAIATDTKLYVEFPVLAHWYDSKRLYDYLTHNPSMMDTYPDLYTFYNAMTNSAIAQETNTDTKMNELLESFAALSPAQQQAQLEDAEQVNEDIDYSEIQDENEGTINAIYLRLLRYGIDSIGDDAKDFITELAPQCPYIGGSAVHKARSLNYYFNPAAAYDDMKTCNAVGVYKHGNSNASNSNGASLITKENEVLSRIKPMHSNLIQNDIMVYPNPANNYVDVNYKSNADAIFKLYNAVGEIILTQKLAKENIKQRVLLNEIANGIYHYEIEFTDKFKLIGKITISN